MRQAEVGGLIPPGAIKKMVEIHKIGEIKYYHESGMVFKVEVLGRRAVAYNAREGMPPVEGVEHKLRILEVVDSGPFREPEVGTIFTTWRACFNPGYGHAFTDE